MDEPIAVFIGDHKLNSGHCKVFLHDVYVYGYYTPFHRQAT